MNEIPIYGESCTRSKTEPTQSTQDLLWLWIYTQSMEHDAMLEENVDEFKRGYTEAMEDVRWGIEFIDNFNKELTDE